MKLAVFGLSVSSSWGNGHAALWRGLICALLRDGHSVTFFERDMPWYAEHRDLAELPDGGKLVLYADWNEVLPQARRALADADVGMVTSYCPDGIAASGLVLDAAVPVRCFYDLDTPVTLARIAAGERVAYLPEGGLGGFDLVLSYTGGGALAALRERLGAQRVAPLYGSVDPDVHRPVSPQPRYAASLSYLGTYAEDRQQALEQLLVEPARRRPEQRFVIGGAMYPASFPWAPNIWFVRHLPPPEHPAFYCSTGFTLNVTRAPMAEMGWCPSGRLFEAAACGTPVISDWWEGLDEFFEPEEEIVIARDAEDVLAAIDTPRAERDALGRRARERALEEHSAAKRASEMMAAFEHAASRRGSLPVEA